MKILKLPDLGQSRRRHVGIVMVMIPKRSISLHPCSDIIEIAYCNIGTMYKASE